ncbi:hypothetical protein ACTJKC_02310 [Pedobacter sp. 22226]
MLFPYFIALILGLVNPADSSTSKCHGKSQVNTAQSSTNNGDGNNGGDTGGETGQTPPPKIGD